MTIVFVRHGEADYRLADERKLPSVEKDFSPLSAAGIRQVHAATNDPAYKDAEIILSSPYTRALQTAEIINRRLGMELHVEFDLHEWKADLDGRYIHWRERDRRWAEYIRLHGEYPEGEARPWETFQSVNTRVRGVLANFVAHKRIIVVCHGTVIMSQCGWDTGRIPFAGNITHRFGR